MGLPYCFVPEFAALFSVLLLSIFPVVCEAASSADCVAGQTYYDSWSDACLACTTAAECGSSAFLFGSCTVDANAICYSCFSSCTDEGFRAPDCGNPPGSAGTCETCRVCGEGDGEEVFPCMWYYDTVCANDCPGNEYYRVQSQSCRVCTACGAGKREFDPCYGIDDRTCTHCPEGTWTTSTSPFDTCNDCTENPCGNAWDGDKYISAVCTAKSDTSCSTCGEQCAAGEFASGCGFGVGGTCTTCRVCDAYAGDYVLAVCGGNQDTICESTCGEGRFWNSFSQACEACNVCGRGQYANPSCGPTNDAACFPCGSVDACDAGEFIGDCGIDSGGNVFRTCEECYVCDSVGRNEWFVAACSGFDDTLCDWCPLPGEAPETCGAPGVLYVTANCSVETQTHVQCGECGLCAYGSEWMSRGCDDFHNVECVACALSCPEDDLANGVEYYVVHQCGMTGSDYEGPLVCEVATVCGDGEFELSGFFSGVVGAGQPVGHNRLCEFCSTGDCPEGQFESSSCDTWSDRTCSNCSVVCDEPGMFVTGGCGGTSNLQCEFCYECGADEYLVRACNETHNSECAECSSVCEAGVTWELQACAGMNDRVCVSCACPAGTYTEVECGLYNGSTCTACSEAGEGEFVKVGCSATADALVENCTDCWSKFTGFAYTKENCTRERDSVCAVCELCNPGFENATYFEKRCEPYSNSECGSCVVCGEGEYEKPACAVSYDGPGFCNECSRCEGNGVERTAWNCTATSDTICIECSECPDAMYNYANCTEFSDTVCRPCDVCLGGGLQYQLQGCTREANTICLNCTLCGDSQFQLIGDLCGQNGLPGQCRDCAICDPATMGLYYAGNCSSFEDSTCGECIGTVENCYRVNESSFSMLQFVSLPCSEFERGMCETCSMTCRAMMGGGFGGEEEAGPLYFGDDSLWYVSEDCGPFYDVKCARCSDPCLETQFQVSPCWDSRYHIGHDRVCQNHSTECPDGKFKLENGSALTDIFCEHCSLACDLWPAPGAYEVVGCSTESDRECRWCRELPSGHFIVSPCNETNDAVFAVHRTCYPQDGLYYVEFGSSDRDAICGSCASCLSWQVVGRENATEYVVSECTLTDPGECGICKPACDRESEWEVVECGGFPSVGYDRECSNLTVCKEDEYEVVAAGPRNNRGCKSCGTCVNGSEYMVSACNSTSGTVCAECQRCDFYALEQGNEYDGGGCDGVVDRLCLTCSGKCNSDEYIEANCSLFEDRKCSLCDVCEDDEFFALECTATSNSLCLSCGGGCSSGWFVEKNCSETENLECAKCSSCSEGTFVKASCSKYADTECLNCTDSCLEGFYKTQDCRNYGVGGNLQCTRCREVRCPLSLSLCCMFCLVVVDVDEMSHVGLSVPSSGLSSGIERLVVVREEGFAGVRVWVP